LQAAGTLESKIGGPPQELDKSNRRTVYARISRGRTSNLLQLYGFPEATMHSPGREATITPLQQLFVMNSAFLRDQASALAQSVASESDTDAKVRALYRKVLAREPNERENAIAVKYLAAGTMADFAHALLCTNEVIYWP
jgi:hypothetical protein